MHFSADVLYSNLRSDLSSHIDPTLPGWAPDSTAKEVACYSLLGSLLKKFNQEDKPSDEACCAALEKFEAVNKQCAEWSLILESTYDEWLVNAVKAEIDRFWFVGGVSPLISDLRRVYHFGKVGKGASLHARDNDFYTKMFDSPLSSTEGIPEIWERCVSESDLSFEAEASRLMEYGHDVVDCSKYSFVNKTRDRKSVV